VRKTIQASHLTDYFNIIHFDSDLKVLTSGKITPEHKEAFFLQIGTVGETVFLLSYYNDKKTKKLLAVIQKVNLSDYTIGTEFLLDEIDQIASFTNDNQSVYLKDQYDNFDNLNPRIYFEDEILKVVTYNSETKMYAEKQYSVDLTLLESIDFKKPSSKIVNDEINTNILTDIPSSLTLKSIGEDNQAGAYCTNNETNLTTHLQGLRYDNTKEKITSEFNYEVTPKEVWEPAAKFIYDANEKKIAKGKTPIKLDFFYRQAILNTDNTTTYIFEQAIYKLPTDHGTSISLTSSYHRGVLQAVNVSEDGTINWSSIIPKRQTTYGRANLLGYRVMQQKDGSLIFAYVNVEPKQPNHIQITSLTPDGEPKVLTNFEVPENMEDVTTNDIKHFYGNSFYLPFIEKKQDGILKFTF
jgi:hypothetical protein